MSVVSLCFDGNVMANCPLLRSMERSLRPTYLIPCDFAANAYSSIRGFFLHKLFVTGVPQHAPNLVDRRCRDWDAI